MAKEFKSESVLVQKNEKASTAQPRAARSFTRSMNLRTVSGGARISLLFELGRVPIQPVEMGKPSAGINQHRPCILSKSPCISPNLQGETGPIWTGTSAMCGEIFLERWRNPSRPGPPANRLRKLDQFLLDAPPSAMRGLCRGSPVDFSTTTVVPIFTRL